MSRKTIFLIIFIIAASITLKAQTIEIKLKPATGFFLPSSQNLSGYYGKDQIICFGGELKAITPFLDLGGFLSVQTYSVNINDPNEIGEPYDENSTIISFGFLKEFDLTLFKLYSKVGLNMHSDKLALNDDETRIGFLLGLEASREIYQGISLNLGVDYDYNNLTIPEYFTFAYSRHQSFLSNTDINSGGVFIYAGIEINIL